MSKSKGHQPARRLGWAAPAYLKKERVNTQPKLSKYNLHDDGKPDAQFGARLMA